MRMRSTNESTILQLKRIISNADAGPVSLRGPSDARAQRDRVSAELTLAESIDAQAHYDARKATAQALSGRVLDELFGSHSIHDALDARLRACDTARSDLRALAPCVEVNALLGRVVSIIQGDYGAPPPDPETELLVRIALEQQIAAEPLLRERAGRIRRSAAVAETAMEQHYSRTLCAELQAVREPFSPQVAGRLRTALLERCLINFPYTRNYRLLTLAELRLLQHPAPPLLLRAAHAARLPLAQRQRFEIELAKLRARAARGTALGCEHTVAVCGSGPLPLSGLMLHTFTDARVQLIERDTSAVAQSRALIAELERLQIIAAGKVEVVHADLAEHTPRAHVVLVASLVDNTVKQQLVQRLRASDTLHALLLRSASSLCAELAYEPVDTLQLTDPSLPFCGEQVPATDVQHRSEHLVCSAREVLNNTELYRPLPLGAADATRWLQELLCQLRCH